MNNFKDALLNIMPEVNVSWMPDSLRQQLKISEETSALFREATRNLSVVPDLTELTNAMQQVYSVQAELSDISRQISSSQSILNEALNAVRLPDSYGALVSSFHSAFNNNAMEPLHLAMEQLRDTLNIDLSVRNPSEIWENVANPGRLISEDADCTDEDLFTTEEIQSAIKEQASDPVSFQKRVFQWTEGKKENYYIVWLILYFFFSIFILPFLQQYVGIPAMTKVLSYIKESPEKNSNVIYTLQEESSLTVLDEDINYYYQVKFVDENGEEHIGYVAKRNIVLIDDEEEDLEESEATSE